MKKAEGRRRKAEGSAFARVLLLSAFCLLPSAFSFAGSQVTAKKAALSTSHPLATRVGLDVLQRGGNAIDAAIAVSFALAVLQPQSGNLGGGGVLVYYDAKTGGVWTLDYTEVAPGAATRDMQRKGVLASGIPGSVAGLDAMHKRFATKPWKELLAPAIRLARDGVPVDNELSFALQTAKAERKIDQFAGTAVTFYPGGKAPAASEKLVQPDLAATLERISLGGAKEFYDGETAKKLIEGVRDAGGLFGYRDLRDYAPVWRAPIRIRYGSYDLYTMAPPSAGGLVIGATLNILNGYDLPSLGWQTPKMLHLVAEAERRAAFDRDKYLGDPGSTRIPYRDLLSATRAEQWRKAIDVNRATPTMSLTEPGTDIAHEHTTHFTIVDEAGNIAAITTTLGDNFGNGFVVPGLGFLLNDAMDGFATAAGKPNSIEPSKRAATSLSPAIVLKDGKPFLAIGTPGGTTIATTILQVFLAVAVYGKSLPDAIAAPRYHQQAAPEELAYERERAPQATVNALNAMGHGVASRESIGDVHAILFSKDTITAVADPRHGGAAGGY